jgi:hypothetical protein
MKKIAANRFPETISGDPDLKPDWKRKAKNEKSI